MEEEDQNELSFTLTELFQDQKDNFLQTLQNILKQTGDDMYIRQMFEEPHSANYVADRLCEIVHTLIANDQEQIIQSLLRRIASVEAVFGKKQSSIEELGSKLLKYIKKKRPEDQKKTRLQIIKQITSAQVELANLAGVTPPAPLSKITAPIASLAHDISKSFPGIPSALNNHYSSILDLMRLARKKTNKLAICYTRQNTEYAKLEKQNAYLIRKLQKASQAIESLQSQLQPVQESFGNQSVSEVISSIQSQAATKLKEHRAQIREQQSLIESLQQEKSALTQLYNESQQRLSDSAQEELKRLQKENNKQKIDLDTKTIQIRDQETKIDELRQDSQIHERVITKLRKDKNELEVALRESLRISEQAKEIKHKLKKVTNENDQLRQELAKKDAKMEEISSKYIEQNMALQQSESNYMSQIQQLKESLAQSSSQVEALQSKSTAQDDEIFSHRNLTQAQNDRIETLTSENLNLKREMDDSIIEVLRLKKTLERTSLRVKQLEESESAAQERAAKSETELAENRAESYQLRAKLAEANEMVKEANDKSERLCYDLEILRRKSADKIDTLQKKVDQLKEADLKLETVTNELSLAQQTVADQNRQLQELRDNYNDKNDRLLEQETILKTMISQNKKLEKQLTQQQTINNEFREEVDRLIGETEIVGEKTREVDRLDALVTNLREQVSNLSDQLKNCKEENDRLIQQNDQLEKKAATVNKLMEELQESRSRCLAMTSEIKAASHEQSEANTMIQQAISQMNAQVVQAEERELIAQTELKREKEKNSEIVKILTEKEKEINLINDEFNEYKESVSQIAQTEDISILQKMREQSAKYEKIQEIMVSENPIVEIPLLKDQSQKYQKFMSEASSLFRSELIDDFPSEIAEIKVKKDELLKKVTEIERATGLTEPSDIISNCEIVKQVKALVQSNDVVKVVASQGAELAEKRDLEKQIRKILGNTKNLPNLIQELKTKSDTLDEALAILDVNNESELIGYMKTLEVANKELQKCQDALVRVLNTSPETVITRLETMASDYDDLKKMSVELMEMLTTDEVIPAVAKLIQNNGRMRVQEGEVMRLFNFDEDDDFQKCVEKVADELNEYKEACEGVTNLLSVDEKAIIESVESLVKSFKEIRSLEEALPVELGDTFNEKVTNLLANYKADEILIERVKEELQSDDLLSELSLKKCQIDSASSLISQLLTVISGREVSLKLPISEEMNDRLSGLVSDFKLRRSESDEVINAILKKATAVGYNGKDAIEGCDFLTSFYAERERQKEAEKMHSELMEVRATAEQERNLEARMRDKNRKKIEEMRKKIEEMELEKMQIQDDAKREISESQSQMRKMKDNVENAQKVREELMRVMAGKSADMTILKKELDQKEQEIVVKAKEILEVTI